MTEAVGQKQSDKRRVRDQVKQGLRSAFRLSLKPSKQHASLAPATSSSSELKPSILTKKTSIPSPDLTTQVESLRISSEAATPSAAQAQSQQAPHGKDLWGVALQRLTEKERAAINLINTSGSYFDTLSSLCDDLDQKLDQSKQKKLQFEIYGRQIIVRDVVSRTLVWINRFKEIGDIVVQFDPVHAALPWAGVRLLLEIATAGHDQMAALFIGVEKVSSMISRCKIYELLYIDNGSSNESSKNLESALVSAYAVVQRFLVNAYWLSDKNAASNTLHALLNPTKIVDFVNDCTVQETQIEIAAEVCQRVCTKAANLESTKRVEDLRQHLLNFEKHLPGLVAQISVMFTQLEASRQSEILQWISPIPYHDSHVSALERRTEGTGQWLLRDSRFCTWQSSNSSTILWLHGSPGTGKTTLVSTVVDELLKNLSGSANDKKALAYFYCDRNRRDYQDPRSILSSFVRQLSMSREGRSVHTSTVQLYDERKMTGFASAQMSFPEVRDQLRILTQKYSQTTLVLDALDECDRSTRMEVVNFLSDLVMQSSRVLRVFISSRPDSDLVAKFRVGPNLEIKAVDNEMDIVKYVEATITNANSPPYWQSLDKELRRHVCRTLVSKSEGMFQWVVLQIRQLHRLFRERDIRMRLGKLPTTLKDAYHEIYDRIQSADGSASEVARRAFQWIMWSEEPMSPAMLVAAVCQDPNTDNIDVVDIRFDFVLEACQNLLKVEIAKEDEICRFSHLSVQEYLENNHRSQLSNNVLLAQVCLTFVTNPIQSSIVLELAGESSESLSICEMEESNEPDEINGSDESDERSVFAVSMLRKTAHWGQAQKDTSEERTKHKEIDRSEELSGSKEIEKGLDKVRYYASSYWLIHVQRSGEVQGDFDSRLITLLKMFLGSGAETTPAYEDWYRARLRQGKSDGWVYSMHSHNTLYLGSLAPPSQPALQVAGFGLHRMLQDSWEHIDPNQKNDNCEPLLAIAASAACASTVQSLLGKGAEINASSVESPSALYQASEGQESVVKVLLANGADVNITGGTRGNPLQVASTGGYASIVEMLLAYGADVNAQGGFSHNALQAASRGGYASIVGLLLAHGADVNAQGGHYHNALQAASSGGYASIVGLLLAHGALVQDGEALVRAASQGYESTVAILLQASKISLNDALVEASERKGARDYNVVKMVIMLLEAGAVDPHGVTLITAAREGYIPVVARLLKEHNVGLDKALISACQQSTKRFWPKTKKHAQRIVVLLLSAGAIDREGHALQAVIENGFQKAANLLRAAAEKKKGRISENAEGLSNENVSLKEASGGSEFQQVAL